MKAFAFRLERLLKLREEAEQRRAIALGEANHAEVSLDRVCRDRASHVEDVAGRAAPAAGQRTSAGMLRALHLTSAAAALQLADAEAARAAARVAADEERARLADARRDRKTLERLKAHQHAAWRDELGRDEQKTMDEIAGRPRGGTRP